MIKEKDIRVVDISITCYFTDKCTLQIMFPFIRYNGYAEIVDGDRFSIDSRAFSIMEYNSLGDYFVLKEIKNTIHITFDNLTEYMRPHLANVYVVGKQI